MTKTIDQITVSELGIILVREATTSEDNTTAPAYFRYSLVPGQDISTQPNNVKQVCTATWTSEVIAAYEAEQAKNTPVLPK